MQWKGQQIEIMLIMEYLSVRHGQLKKVML